MKGPLKYSFAITIIASLVSCSNSKTQTEEVVTTTVIDQYSKIKDLNWLDGEWKNQTAEGTSVEMWEGLNDSTLNGKAYILAINGKDTVFSENLKIEQHGADLFYIPTVKDQNSGQPVKFKLTNATDKQLIFENPQHDFPQKITYNKISNDSIVAEISGTQNGKTSAILFPMKRVN